MKTTIILLFSALSTLLQGQALIEHATIYTKNKEALKEVSIWRILGNAIEYSQEDNMHDLELSSIKYVSDNQWIYLPNSAQGFYTIENNAFNRSRLKKTNFVYDLLVVGADTHVVEVVKIRRLAIELVDLCHHNKNGITYQKIKDIKFFTYNNLPFFITSMGYDSHSLKGMSCKEDLLETTSGIVACKVLTLSEKGVEIITRRRGADKKEIIPLHQIKSLKWNNNYMVNKEGKLYFNLSSSLNETP